MLQDISEITKSIEELFSIKPESTDAGYSLVIKDNRNKAKISLDILSEENSYLISVYTNNCHLQLQSCSRFVISKMLEEIIFISETDEHLSGLIISKEGDCSMYSNVPKQLISSDFGELTSEKLLAAVALSVTETA